MPRIYSSSRRNFIEAALLSETDDCILWPFAVRKSSGYGAYDEGQEASKKNYDVHRYVCEKAHGPAPENYETRHLCSRKLCINPRHVLWGNHLMNMTDAKSHGALRGGGIHRQKIFALDRAKIKASKESLVTIAARYGMEPSHIGKVRRLPPQFDL